MDIAQSVTVRCRTSRAEDLVFVAASVWVMIGLCLDGWAHRHQPELETFFTPWHAVFYAGFSAAAAWLAYIVIRRRAGAASLTDAVPVGYGLSVVGLGVFAVGGVGDGIWHTVFGIESSIDALLSPTHLLMLTGMSMSAAAPIRAAWSDDTREVPSSLSSFLAPTLSTAVLATGFAFFFLYANGFSNWPMNSEFRPRQTEVTVALGILSTMATTVILLGAVMYLLRRWRPPFGTFTVIFGTVGVFMSGLDAFAHGWQIVAPVAGGLTADAVIGIGSTRSRQWQAGAAGLIVPLVMWSVSTLALHQAWGVLWPPELWAGQIILAMMLGYGLSLLAFPAPVPPSATPSPANAEPSPSPPVLR